MYGREQRVLLRHYLERGLTKAEVARELGVSRRTVYHWIAAGQLEVSPPTVVPWEDLPKAHQSMWDNTHAGANYVVNHALPRTGLRSRDELFQEWGARR